MTSHLLEWLYFFTVENNKCRRRYGEIGILLCFWRRCNTVQQQWKTVWLVLRKLNTELLYDPAIPFLDMHPKELKTGTQTDPCIPVFITALFTIAKRCKQLQCPSTDGRQWVNKTWNIHSREYYSALKRNGVLIQAKTWMKLKNII